MLQAALMGLSLIIATPLPYTVSPMPAIYPNTNQPLGTPTGPIGILRRRHMPTALMHAIPNPHENCYKYPCILKLQSPQQATFFALKAGFEYTHKSKKRFAPQHHQT